VYLLENCWVCTGVYGSVPDINCYLKIVYFRNRVV
jgi:hypothetical protein